MPGTDDLYAARLARAEEHRRQGIDPYGGAFPVTHRVADLPGVPDGLAAPVAVAGRLTASRPHGGAAFADLLDATGRIQIYVRRDRAPDAFALLGRLDLGDICGARGRLFRTRTGELTLEAGKLTLLTKALRPLPDKFHGLQDVEERYRHRHLDLIANPRAREVFRRRAAILGALRAELDRQGYLEAETPVLQPLHGGAAARPFETRFQALGCPYYLRIATELHLKRLLVGGLDRVYEQGRVFPALRPV